MDALTQPNLDIPPAWKQLDLDALHGVVLVVGGVDVGKSTFARYLFQALRIRGRGRGRGQRLAFLDGDPGQSWLGPPTTLTCAFDLEVDPSAGLAEGVRRVFIGSISPSGHMLPAVVGGARLAQAALAEGAQVVIYDTSGLINPQQGGLALKLAKIELLRPAAIIGIQAEQELEPLLTPLRRLRRMNVVTLRPSPAIQRRDQPARKAHRARQFARYFSNARPLALDWARLAIFPLPVFRLNRLLALEDGEGFTLGLGIVTHIDRANRQVTLLTPLASTRDLESLRLGDILLDLHTFLDEKINM